MGTKFKFPLSLFCFFFPFCAFIPSFFDRKMEYVAVAAQKHYNGGIMFVSYLIAVAGAQTTLELLNRRTHITGVYNWY